MHNVFDVLRLIFGWESIIVIRVPPAHRCDMRTREREGGTKWRVHYDMLQWEIVTTETEASES